MRDRIIEFIRSAIADDYNLARLEPFYQWPAKKKSLKQHSNTKAASQNVENMYLFKFRLHSVSELYL
jgi:hypothetical protein